MHEDSKTAEFGDHEKSDVNKIKIQKEKAYIVEKNNYHPSKFWRYAGLFMRILDGSMIHAFTNKKNLVGHKIQEKFNFGYNILLNI